MEICSDNQKYGKYPADGINCHQCAKRGVCGKNRIDVDDPEYAYPQKAGRRRIEGMSHTPHAARAGFYDHVEKFKGQDVAYAQHRVLDNCPIRRINSSQIRRKDGNQQADYAV